MIGEHAKLIPAEPREGYNRLRVYVHHTEHESFNRPPTPWEVRRGVVLDEGLWNDRRPVMDIDNVVEETTEAGSQSRE